MKYGLNRPFKQYSGHLSLGFVIELDLDQHYTSLRRERERISDCRAQPHPRPLGHQEKQVNLCQSGGGNKVEPVGCLNGMRGCSEACLGVPSEHQAQRNTSDMAMILRVFLFPEHVDKDDKPHRRAGCSNRCHPTRAGLDCAAIQWTRNAAVVPLSPSDAGVTALPPPAQNRHKPFLVRV